MVGLDRQHAQIDHRRRIVEVAAGAGAAAASATCASARAFKTAPVTPRIGRIGMPTSGALSRNR